jgi:hypothetical protein
MLWVRGLPPLWAMVTPLFFFFFFFLKSQRSMMICGIYIRRIQCRARAYICQCAAVSFPPNCSGDKKGRMGICNNVPSPDPGTALAGLGRVGFTKRAKSKVAISRAWPPVTKPVPQCSSHATTDQTNLTRSGKTRFAPCSWKIKKGLQYDTLLC